LPGLLGLAPEWVHRGLTASERLWWGACLAAHTNRYGVPVEISVRGDAASLATTTTERSTFTKREGAFWATYNPDAAVPLHFYTCFDEKNATVSAMLANRTCTLGASKCGPMFTTLMGCRNLGAPACEGERGSDKAYFNCHLKSGTPMGTFSDAAVTEVLTVFTR
jgi:hypothetical protein